MERNSLKRNGIRQLAAKWQLEQARIIKKLPSIFGRRGAVPRDLEGATIVAFGTTRDPSGVEGGGLFIDYRPAGGTAAKRLVLAFDETAMWVVGQFSEA